MKVRCVQLIDAFGKPQERSDWLTKGKVYQVLSVYQGADRKWKLRLVGDGLNGVALFSMEGFEVMTSTIPPTWIASWGNQGAFDMSPEPWTRVGFWEDFYDQKPYALKIFEEEVRKIVESEPGFDGRRHSP